MKARIFFFLFFLSGATGLIYEIVWTRLFILVFGSTVLGISTIVTAFLGGLALGGFLLGKWSDRIPKPLRSYGLFEIGIGLYGCLIPLFLGAAEPVLTSLWKMSSGNYEIFSLLRFFLAVVILLLPTALMGGTLPLLATVASPNASVKNNHAEVGVLYGLNTLGAVLGTLLASFFLLPRLGVQATIWVCAGGNLGVGLLALWLDRSENRPFSSPEKNPAPPLSADEKSVLTTAFLSGFAALSLEICWSRLLGTIYGSSLHGFAVTLAGFLIGIGFGSLGFSGRLQRKPASFFSYSCVEFGIAFGALLTFPLIHEIVYWNHRLIVQFRENPAGWLFVRYTMSSLILLLPTLFMGMAFPAALSLLGGQKHSGSRSGLLYGWNTLGSILGSFTGGFFLLPWLGLELTILFSVLLLWLISLFLIWKAYLRGEKPSALSKSLLGFFALCGLAVFWLRPSWNPALLSSGGIYFRYRENMPASREEFFEQFNQASYKKTLFYKDGRNASVGVYENQSNHRYLEVNGKVDASNGPADMPTQVLSGFLPTIAKPHAKRALVIGCGSGTTAGVLAEYPGIEEVKLVELESAVIAGTRFFEAVNHRPLDNPKLRWVENDGRNQLLLSPEKYDIIVSEPSNPWMSGAANLFTREFFELVRDRLEDDGVYGQWAQLYAIEPEDLKVLLRTLRSVFPECLVFQVNQVDLITLCWKKGPAVLDVTSLMQGFDKSPISRTLQELRLSSGGENNASTPASVLSLFRLDPAMVRSFAGEGEFNTDDNLRIESSTPFSLFRNTNEENRDAIGRFPGQLFPRLSFPPPGPESSRLILRLAVDFQVNSQKKFAREFFQEFLKRENLDKLSAEQLSIRLSDPAYPKALDLAKQLDLLSEKK